MKKEAVVPEPKKKTYVHTYVMLLLGEHNLSQTALANKAGCSVQMISAVLLNKKISAPVQAVIATSLGYESWETLASAALIFSDLFSSMYNAPSSRPSSKNEEAVHVG